MKDAGPLAIYQRRIGGLGRDIARLGRWDTAITWARVVVFFAGAALAVLALRRDVHPWWPLGMAGAFAVVIAVHGRVIFRRERLRAALALCEDGVERIHDRWAGHGDAGERFQADAEEHLFANDLDLFGKGGLFELLSVARTPIGQTTLVAWLKAPAEPAVARGRQEAVAELGPDLDLRHELALAATALEENVREEALMAWAARVPTGLPASFRAWRGLLGVAASATVVGAVLWGTGVVGPWPMVASFVVGAALSNRLREPVAQILAGIDRRADELATLAALMAQVENLTFRSATMRALVETLRSGGATPSRRILQLQRLVHVAEQRRNQAAAVLLGAVQATAQLALAIEAWRREVGPAVLRWMAAVGELEALSSLACFHFERPELPFPTIVESPSERAPVFVAEALGHPLIPGARRVTNDVRIGGDLRLMLVSGSNMSGKSTLLRSVGVNAVLALAGAPVCARRLELSPVTLGATLRINDSLQEGKSRFYAEVTRLKKIVDRAGREPPLLFLLDEILHGTNSHDRRIGAEAVIRGLIERGSVGIVTTHDLALADMAEALGPRAANVHFEDHLENGVMTFDFRMKPGVVRRSNALELMRAIGLEV